MRISLVLIALCFSLASVNEVMALPSTDLKFRTQVELPDKSTAVLTRDPFNPYAWYYIPPALRLAENADGLPKFRWIEFTLGAKQHAILQFAVRGDIDKESEKLLKKEVVKWFETQKQSDRSVVVPDASQILLSPVGPIKLANMRCLVLKNKLIEVITDLDTGDPVIPADPRPMKQDEKGEAVPEVKRIEGRPTALPAVTELNQETWCQFEIVGPGVQVVRELISGKDGQGGIILVYSGKYAAYAPEVGVKVSLDVNAFASYFRDRKYHSSGWSFLGLFGNRNTRLQDYVNTRAELKNALTVTRIGGGELKAEDYDKIEARLHAWITAQVFEPPTAKPSTTTITDPSRDKLFNAGHILRIPGSFGLGGLHAELPLGYTSANSELTVRAVGSTKIEAKAEWKGFDVIQADIVVYGAMGLQPFEAKKPGTITKLIQKPIKLVNPTTLYVAFPPASTPTLRSLYSGSIVTLNANGVRTIRGTSDGNWEVIGEALKNAIPGGHGVVVFFDPNTNIEDSTALWSLPDPNRIAEAANTPPGKELAGLPAFKISKKLEPKGSTIAFWADSFPYRPVMVDVDSLVTFIEPGSLGGLKVRATLTMDTKGKGGEDWKKPWSVSYKILDKQEKSQEKYVAGMITDLSVHFDGQYSDAFLGQISLGSQKANPAWVKNQIARLNNTLDMPDNAQRVVPQGVGYIPVEPATLGLYRFRLSFNRLLLEGASECEVEIKSQEGKIRKLSMALKDNVARDLATSRPLPEGIINLSSKERPATVSGRARDAKGEWRALKLDPETDVLPWSARDGDTLILR